MGVLPIVLAGVCLSGVAPGSADCVETDPARAMSPSESRISQIAAYLPEEPAWTEDRPSFARGKAEALLLEPIPECSDEGYLIFSRTGSRDEHQCAYFGRTANLLVLAVAAQETGEDSYLNAVVRYLEAICAERAWTMPAHDKDLRVFNGETVKIDLGAAQRAYELAFALSLLKGRLPAGTDAKTLSEIERRVFSPYRRTASGIVDELSKLNRWWFFGRSNWNAVCHSVVVRAALALVADRRDRAVFVEAAERAMPFFLSGFLDDGYCTEGGGYWNYGYGNFLHLVASVRKATGGRVDFSRMSRARAPMEYGFGYRLVGNICPNYADGGARAASRENLKLGVAIWPEYAPFLFRELPPRSYFPNAQVYIGRSRRMAFSVKGGTNAELHNHNDLGSWDLNVDGISIAGDPEGEHYTARTFSARRYESNVLNSHGHPVPVVNGQLQGTGADYAARITGIEFTDGRDTVELDLSKAYPVPPESLLRTVVFDRAAERVVVRDVVKYESPSRFESAMSTYSSIEEGADPGSFALVASNGSQETRVVVSVSVSGGDWTWTDETYENPNRRSPHRRAVRFSSPVLEASVTWVFTPADRLAHVKEFRPEKTGMSKSREKEVGIK